MHLQNLPTVESSGRGSGSLEIETSAPKPQLSPQEDVPHAREAVDHRWKLISISMMLLILLSTVSFIMEGEVTVGNLPHDLWFYIFDSSTRFDFKPAVEYLLRILLCYRRVSS